MAEGRKKLAPSPFSLSARLGCVYVHGMGAEEMMCFEAVCALRCTTMS